jgi:hypothetical protein
VKLGITGRSVQLTEGREMAVRAYPGGAANGAVSKSTGVSGATTGVKLTYTAPAGSAGKLQGASVFPTAGAATVQVLLRLSGTTIIVAQATTAIAFSVPHNLNPGDQVQVNVSVLDAASVFDACISVDEYPVV